MRISYTLFTHDEVGQLLRAKEPYERKPIPIILAQKRRMLMPALSKLRFDELVQGLPGPIENNAADGCGHSAAKGKKSRALEWKWDPRIIG